MEGSAPKETSQYVDVDEQTQALHRAVAAEARKAGHHITATDVNPGDRTPLNNIREMFGDAAHVVGTAGTLLGVEEPSTHVRTTGGKVPIAIALRRRFLRKAA